MLRIFLGKAMPALRPLTNLTAVHPSSITPRRHCSSVEENDERIIAWSKTLNTGDAEKVRYIRNEITYNMLNDDMPFGPDDVTIPEYVALLTLSANQRTKFYRNLRKKKVSDRHFQEKANLRKQLLAEKRLYEQAEVADPLKPKHIQYGLGHCSIFHRVRNTTVDKWDNLRVFGAMLRNESKIIVDCGFENQMIAREVKETAEQIITSFAENRQHRTPFVMHLCNLHQSGQLWYELSKEMPMFGTSKIPMYVHKEECYDLFPKENLVVLSMYSPNLLKEYDPSMHYVLGGYVKRGRDIPLSMTKAKEMGLQTARLPLDVYKSLHSNYKSMPMNQLLRILLEVKYSKSWDQAFKHIPSRFLK